MLNFCSCQTARCFNKSKGVLITGLKLKAFRNPQPSWGFSIDKEGVIHSYSPDEEAYYGVGMDSSGIDIEDLMPVWSNDPRLPALIRIDHVGDQAIFIYITERDANGEYPIARMERNEFWLAESSLVEYLYNIISGAKDIGFTEEDLHLPQWKAQQKMNEQRDAALLDLEDYHEAFWAKLDALVD
ncbi:DUF5066 family protein [Salmonella enterica]|uniref:DUF5066 family protein n=1 Tax=Salmonella enterica TaxID=28901 RepID=UPI000C7EA5E2